MDIIIEGEKARAINQKNQRIGETIGCFFRITFPPMIKKNSAMAMNSVGNIAEMIVFIILQNVQDHSTDRLSELGLFVEVIVKEKLWIEAPIWSSASTCSLFLLSFIVLVTCWELFCQIDLLSAIKTLNRLTLQCGFS